MDHVFILFLVGAAANSVVHVSGSGVIWTGHPGHNTTLHCDCRFSTGEYIVWYRNCSHEDQPTLVMRTKYTADRYGIKDNNDNDVIPFPRFHLVRNESSKSYDLMIINITHSDEGLYYCGTEKSTSGKGGPANVPERYGQVTRMVLSRKYPGESQQHESCGLCWWLLFSLCPATAVFTSLLSAGLVYLFCRKTEPEVHEKGLKSSERTSGNKDEDVCYAALEIRGNAPKKKKTPSSDFSTYSAINTHRMQSVM